MSMKNFPASNARNILPSITTNCPDTPANMAVCTKTKNP